MVGGKCDRLLNELVQGVEVKAVQCAELWAFVAKKEATEVRQKDYRLETGDSYTWLALEHL